MKAHRRPLYILDDSRARTSSFDLTPALQDSFSERRVEGVPIEKFRDAIRHDKAAIIVMPGIYGEDSPLFEVLGGEEGERELQDFVKRGGIVIAVCAGAYKATGITEYVTEDGRKKMRVNYTPLFNGVARGSLEAIMSDPDNQKQHDGHLAARVKFTAKGGGEEIAKIAYMNGPALYADVEDESLEVLARYADVPGAPIAMALQHLGKGVTVLFGVLPYMPYQQLEDHPGNRKARKMMSEIRDSELARQYLWGLAVEKIKAHLNGNHGKTLAPQPEP